MDVNEQQEIALFLKASLEERIKIKHVMFDFDLWALAIAQKDDKETGRIFREFVELCRGRQPETKEPETFSSRQALKGLSNAYANRKKKQESAFKRWEREQAEKANGKN